MSPDTTDARPLGLRVGFIGLGVMGRPMAANVMAAGFQVRAYQRSVTTATRPAIDGLTMVTSSRALAETSDVLVIVVGDLAALEDVIFGDDGVLSGVHAGSVVVAMGTHEPWAMPVIATRLAERGAMFLDAPVSGGERGARDGSLAIMVGGDVETFHRIRPVLDAMGSRVVHVGPVGAGQITKACNQLIVGSTIEAVAEALTLARRLGVDPAKVREVMLGGFAASRVLEEHGRRMLDDDFTPGGRTVLHAKDARIVLEAAARVGLRLPGFAPVAAALDAMVERGLGDQDHSALIQLLSEPIEPADGQGGGPA